MCVKKLRDCFATNGRKILYIYIINTYFVSTNIHSSYFMFIFFYQCNPSYSKHQLILFTHTGLLYTLSTDINECISGSAECHDNATCTNTDGSYECTCDTGFTGDGFNCTSEIEVCIFVSP